MKHITTMLVLVALAIPAQAQRGYEDDPGYVDLSEIERFFDSETTLEVNVRGALLRMVAEAARIEDDDLADMLLKLRAIHVRGYSLDWTSVLAAREQIDAMAGRLSGDGWDRVVRVRAEDEFVEMLMYAPDDHIEGMMVFVMTEGEHGTVFVNIVGDIEPEDISRIGRKFRIRALENL